MVTNTVGSSSGLLAGKSNAASVWMCVRVRVTTLTRVAVAVAVAVVMLVLCDLEAGGRPGIAPVGRIVKPVPEPKLKLEPVG